MKNVTKIFLAAALFIAAAGFVLTSCTKEGPQGPSGTNGTNGTDGKDAAETCKQCHAKAVVDRIATQFELSKHSWGSAAFEEAGNPGCDPCHTQLGFLYVVDNNIPATFTLTGGKWVNNYSAVYSASIGAISCFTCHSSLHTTYGAADLALSTTAAVPMTMRGGALTIDLTQDSSRSNLCVKCHQPRPLTANTSYDPSGRLLNYDSLVIDPLFVQYDTTPGAQNKGIKPSYRMHNHYGVVGAVFAGKGGIEYPGTEDYNSSPHTTVASCQDCHMSEPMYGIAGGHAFNMRNAKESALSSSTTWNFSGCNVTGCHALNPLDANTAKFKNTRTEIQGLLNDLAAKINAVGGGHDLLHRDASATNLWWGLTTNNYDGYLDIYDASSNPTGYWKLTSQPKFPSLLNVQVGALINFQFCLREYSLGIHNTQYVRALLTNSVQALTAAGL
ncbi:MAG: hypothetical protein NTU98_07440 [Bacteroidetes bacterium]|nr:hypothetical protein [Bacteroidota bacterium]